MSRKHLSFEFNGKQFESTLAAIPIELFNNCVECGKPECNEIVTITQYGLFDDRVLSVFRCTHCATLFHFDYLVPARYELTDAGNLEVREAV